MNGVLPRAFSLLALVCWALLGVGCAQMTELQEAADGGDLREVQAILDAGESPNHETGFFGPVLDVAVRAEEVEVVRLLLERGAEPGGRYALADAAYRGNLELVQLLVKAGADPSLSPYGDVPLCSAARQGHLEVVDYLLAQGADPNGPEDRRWESVRCPLYMALRAGEEEAAQLLVAAGARREGKVYPRDKAR